MPHSPPKPCRQPGCPNLTHESYCPTHAPLHKRATASERGYGSKWQRRRRAYLRVHPLCAECQRAGRITVATVVDHINPHRGDERLMWDEANWQALCKRCHDRKTGTHDSTPEYNYNF